eukprot:CAMPEP_0204154316 /NCGR_PEP_ID=MMETSP0361-20130328/28614_1 /ASSEMBLY_ACC=CAM_ASM_000343 /TAXON_ID=268821 /ORGANISM="Scrippsiella Hangoei, Strain SHTV-5" /LENGTH=50 /DNA_ID=CAMNT_0051109569 /DNA_START=17 /DNA_END=166 /DNA_ORIENTATION=-
MTNITILQQLTAGQKAVAWAEAAVGSLARCSAARAAARICPCTEPRALKN